MKNLKITVNGTAYDVQVEEVSASSSAPAPAAVAAPVVPSPKADVPTRPAESASAPKAPVPTDAELVACPMPGTIVSVNVQPGQSVKKNDVLVILEAMKMENEIMAPHDAVVAAIHVNKGDSVNSGSPLVSLQ